MTRTPNEALAYTRQHPQLPRAGLCKMMCRTAYGVPSDGTPDATAASHRAELHKGKPPHGALLWWRGGRNGHGHVAIYDETSDTIRTTDLPVSGRWGNAKLGDPERLWGLTYVGWSPDIDGVRVLPKPKPKPKPPSRLAKLRAQLDAVARDPKVGPARRRAAAAAAKRLRPFS